MKTRKLGTAGLEVCAIGFGCMGISQSYGEPLTGPSRPQTAVSTAS